ncbi:hypothetical protein [Sphingomonas lenta]|uniref:Uncharacterized protein n=1 Tax=Sphingomonas lenta TaxID=1141887 RepID=A0A2A2SD36_9SPHN|nr:hypothetical protein [Sphingomonas lenta]PAX07204.1 hypothetical protein CKY28_14315 [Sphingomonas lenta]
MRQSVVLAVLLALAACNQGTDNSDELARLDNELAGVNAADPARDPAVAAALQDQIMVDPRLTQGSNANAIRPPNRPDGGATAPVDIAARSDAPAPAGLASAPDAKTDCPECRRRDDALTLGALAEGNGMAACANRIRYSAGWANRLPAAAALYPNARVVEAAGTDEAGCSLRVVTFRSSAPLKQLADWYYTRGRKAGYSAEHRAEDGTHVVGGVRGQAAYLAYLRPRGDGGTDVDLVANGG